MGHSLTCCATEGSKTIEHVDFSEGNVIKVSEDLKGGSPTNFLSEIASTKENSSSSLRSSGSDSDSPQGGITPVAANVQELEHSPCGLSDSTREVLEKVRRLVEEDFDVLAAQVVLADLRRELLARADGQAEWAAVTTSHVFGRFRANLDLYTRVGQRCCDESEDWFCIYKDATGTQTIMGRFDPHSSRGFQYRACVTVPASMPQVMAVANEVELGQLWQPALVAKPEVLGVRTACRLVVHSQLLLAGGFLKVDSLNDVKRFVHREGGFLAEYIRSAGLDHPNYCEPKSGFRRLDTEVFNVWLACGSDSTTLIQVGKLQLPVPVTRWLVNMVGGFAGSKILSSLTRNALLSAEPGSPWEQPVKEDRLGFYRLLTDCTKANGSAARQASGQSRLSPSSLESLRCFFSEEHLQKECSAAAP